MLTAPSGLPCSRPPFGALVAVDLRGGRIAWTVSLGDPSSLKPELAALSSTPLGTPNLGGPIVTAGGLIFIGAAVDHVLRAFDVETGRELWKGALPAGARATPMTYQVNGRQFVVIAAGGNEDWGKGNSIIAFSLP
jgi:quinoprotein glucose dehydrogenase